MFVAFVFALFSAFTFAQEDGTRSDVVVLTESNFELETQASTGSTTGDWLVEFYAPWYFISFISFTSVFLLLLLFLLLFLIYL